MSSMTEEKEDLSSLRRDRDDDVCDCNDVENVGTLLWRCRSDLDDEF